MVFHIANIAIIIQFVLEPHISPAIDRFIIVDMEITVANCTANNRIVSDPSHSTAHIWNIPEPMAIMKNDIFTV